MRLRCSVAAPVRGRRRQRWAEPGAGQAPGRHPDNAGGWGAGAAAGPSPRGDDRSPGPARQRRGRGVVQPGLVLGPAAYAEQLKPGLARRCRRRVKTDPAATPGGPLSAVVDSRRCGPASGGQRVAGPALVCRAGHAGRQATCWTGRRSWLGEPGDRPGLRDLGQEAWAALGARDTADRVEARTLMLPLPRRVCDGGRAHDAGPGGERLAGRPPGCGHRRGVRRRAAPRPVGTAATAGDDGPGLMLRGAYAGDRALIVDRDREGSRCQRPRSRPTTAGPVGVVEQSRLVPTPVSARRRALNWLQPRRARCARSGGGWGRTGVGESGGRGAGAGERGPGERGCGVT